MDGTDARSTLDEAGCCRRSQQDAHRFQTLLRRNLILLRRTWKQLIGVFAEFLLMGLTIGYIYTDLTQDARGARDRLSLLYLCSTLVPFHVILSAISKGMLHSMQSTRCRSKASDLRALLQTRSL